MHRRQGREPTCPMCNATIELEILYRLPLPWSTRQALDNPLGPQLPPHHPVSNLCCLSVLPTTKSPSCIAGSISQCAGMSSDVLLAAAVLNMHKQSVLP